MLVFCFFFKTDEGKILSFTDAHRGSMKILEPWQLLVIPFTNLHMTSQVYLEHFFFFFNWFKRNALKCCANLCFGRFLMEQSCG